MDILIAQLRFGRGVLPEQRLHAHGIFAGQLGLDQINPGLMREVLEIIPNRLNRRRELFGGGFEGASEDCLGSSGPGAPAWVGGPVASRHRLHQGVRAPVE